MRDTENGRCKTHLCVIQTLNFVAKSGLAGEGQRCGKLVCVSSQLRTLLENIHTEQTGLEEFMVM